MQIADYQCNIWGILFILVIMRSLTYLIYIFVALNIEDKSSLRDTIT